MAELIKNFKFTKNSRLLNKADFEFLRTGSQRFYFDHIILFYKPSRLNSETHRLGFSISKKIGSAIIRNRIRRALREEFRLSLNKFGHHDILIVMNFKRLGKKPEVDDSFIKNIRSELSSALSKITPQVV